MSDFTVASIGDLPIDIGDGNYSNKYPKASEFVETGIPFISASDFSNGRISPKDFRFITEEQHSTLLKGHLKPGDVLIVTRGNGTGDVAWVDPEYDDFNINAQLVLLRADEEVLHNRFLYYLLSSKEYKETFVSYSSGSAQPQLPIRALKQVDLKFPSYEEQMEIGKQLSAIDDKIELNRQTNQTLEHIAQALFKSWFVNFEPTRAKIIAKQAGQDPMRAAMAVISGKALDELEQLSPVQHEQLKTTAALFPDALVDSELGEIPEGWKVKALDEIAHYQNGLALQKFRPEDENDFLPVLKIAQLKKGFADGVEKASPNIKSECIVDNGDVVFSWSGSLVVDVWCGGKVALNQHLFKVTSSDYPKWFYCYWTKYYLKEFQQVAADKAVTMGHIKRSHLAEAKCTVPNGDLDSFDLIADFLEKQIEQRVESASLKEIRDSLLPRLLSGDLGVAV